MRNKIREWDDGEVRIFGGVLMIEERIWKRWGWWMRMTAMAAIIASGASREDGGE